MPLIPVGPPKAPPVLPTWSEPFTLIFRLPSGAIHSEDGIRYGTLAIHATLDEDQPAVTVTHLPTKTPMFYADEVEDAVALTEALWLRCGAALKRRGEEIERLLISADDMAWIKACQKARKAV